MRDFINSLKRYWQIAKIALLQEKTAGNDLLKAMNNHEKEFLPAALSVMERPPSSSARILTFFIAFMFSVLIIWACVGKIDIIATSTGKLMPASNIKTIQTLQDGEIDEIYVVEGQYVKEGDNLIKLNDTEVMASIRRVKHEISALNISISRLMSLLTDDPVDNFIYDDGISEDLIRMHTSLLKSQVLEKSSNIDVLEGQVIKAMKEREIIQAEINRLNRILPSVQERIDKRRILVEKQLLAKLSFMELEEQLTNMKEEIKIQESKKIQAEENIAFLKKEKLQYIAKFDMSISKELTEAKEKLTSYEQELIKYEEALKRTLIKAPISGYVQQLVYHTRGGVIETAKPIMNLVPEDYQLEADVMILNKDIGFVSEEQDVEIKVDSFPFTKYGTIKGVVRNISGDAINDEKLGLVYSARLKLLDNKISADGRIVQLKPGMSVTAEIKTGKRRVIEYLLSPIMKYMNESMRER